MSLHGFNIVIYIVKGKVENCVEYYRKKSEMTQEKLSKLVGVSRQTIVSIEKGDYMPSVYLAIKISNLLGKKVENVFTCVDD